jgi:tetratricopeptide (TPR) repeat protein
MRKAIFLLILSLFPIPAFNAQSETAGRQNKETEESLLLMELRVLETDAAKLEKPLALAAAKAEIASAGWTLDREWAKKLLREAYQLTLPPEAEQIELRDKLVGAPPILSTSNDRARNEVRRRVLSVASRDKSFGEELVKFGLEKLGSYETHQRYSELAYQAARQGDVEAASDYTLKAIETDPTYLGPVQVINEIAVKDRGAADRLILQYIDRLGRFPLSYENQSTMRTSFILNMLVYPRSAFNEPTPDIPSPGVAVMRAYVVYEVERFGKLDEATLRRARSGLLLVWEPLKKYAPDLTTTFMELEARSRMAGDNSPLPTKQSSQEQNKERYEKRLKDALDSGEADELTINFAISRGDFERARKLIAKLPDGAQKTQLTDTVNSKEAISLAARGDIVGAERLAEQLTRAVSMLEAYPAIIKRCVADKNQACVSLLAHKAVRQLKRADLTLATPPAGIPASIVPSNREFDPVLSGLSKLASLIAPLDEQVALEVLDEVIAAANASALDTEQGRTGIDVELFPRLSSRNEVRVRQAAETFKDRLRRIVALSAIYQAQAAELGAGRTAH